MLLHTQNLPVSSGWSPPICMLKHSGLAALVPRPATQGVNRGSINSTCAASCYSERPPCSTPSTCAASCYLDRHQWEHTSPGQACRLLLWRPLPESVQQPDERCQHQAQLADGSVLRAKVTLCPLPDGIRNLHRAKEIGLCQHCLAGMVTWRPSLMPSDSCTQPKCLAHANTASMH